MGKNYRDRLMANQSVARASSASTETDYIPATVPFEWEAAPGRPAAAPAEREPVDEAPSLPLPPGRRAKDGFFLPIPRPGDADSRGIDSSTHTERRRPFKLKFPGRSSKQTVSHGRRVREDADAGSIFNPLSGHRFGSRVTRRVLVESRKSPPSWFGQCLLRRGASSYVEHLNRGRGLDDSDGDEEQYVTPASGSPLSGSPRHGHDQTRHSSEAGARVPTNRYRFNMASMLLSLCPFDESDQGEAGVDGGNGIADDYGISEPDLTTTPTAPVVSSFGSSGKLQQARPGTNESDQGNNVADAYSVSASPDREPSLWPTTKGPCRSTLSRKPSDQIRVQLDPLAASVTANAAQEPGESEFANLEMSDEVAGEEEIGSCSSLERNFSVRRSHCSSTLHEFVWSGPNHPSTSTIKSARNMVESLATPRSSCGSSDYSFITSCSADHYPKAEVERGRSTSCSATTPTAEPESPLERNSSRERLEPNQSPATRPISSIPPLSLLLNQARLHITTPKASIRIEDKKVPSNSPAWLEELKSSSLWPIRAPKRAPKTSTHDDSGNGDNSGVESGEEFENSSSTDSFEYGTPRAGLSIPSGSSPVPCTLNTSPKPAIWVVSEEVLQSSSLLKCMLQRQQSYEWPRSSFMSDQETSSTTFEQIDVPAPRVLTCAPDECQQANSPDHGSKDEKLAVLLPAGRLSETSKSSSSVMSKAAQGGSKSGVGPSSKLLPIYLRRRGSTIVTGKAVSRCDSGNESGDDSENSSTDSSEHGTPRAVPLVFCKFTTSFESEAWVSEEVSEEVLKSFSLLKCKLQCQLRSMGLQTSSMHGANRFENSSTDLIEHGTPRAVSPIPSLNSPARSPVFCKFIISLEPEAWMVSEEVSDKF